MIPELIRRLKPELPGGAGDTQKLFIVAFDPGVRTGWCVMRIQVDALLEVGLRGVCLDAGGDPDVFAWNAGYVQGPDPWQAELMMALTRGTWVYEGVWDQGPESDYFVVFTEQFRLRILSSDTDLVSPIRVSSCYEMLAWRAPFPRVEWGPSDAMSVFPDSRLRSLNLYSGPVSKIGEHQRDATRHAGLLARKFCETGFRKDLLGRMPWLRE